MNNITNMEVGTIIRTKNNVNNYGEPNYKYSYYEYRNCPFILTSHDGYGDDMSYSFIGPHFVCLNSEYYDYVGNIFGLELLNEEHEIVNSVPELNNKVPI